MDLDVIKNKFEEYHSDLRKLKAIFKSTGYSFNKFSRNINDIIKLSAPNKRWNENDSLFFSIKISMTKFMEKMNLMSLNFYELHDRLKQYGNDYKVTKKEILKEIKLSVNNQNKDTEGLKAKIEEKYRNTNAILKDTFHVYIERLSSIVEVKDMMNIEKLRNDNVAPGMESLKKKYSMILNEYNYKPTQQLSFDHENKQNKTFEELNRNRVIDKGEDYSIGGMENIERLSNINPQKINNEIENKNINEYDVPKKN